MKDEMVRVNVLVGKEQWRRMRHLLVEEGEAFSAWLRKRIDAYLDEKTPVWVKVIEEEREMIRGVVKVKEHKPKTNQRAMSAKKEPKRK
jgi:hypothetical protein